MMGPTLYQYEVKWESNLPHGQRVRSVIIITQSILGKYIGLPVSIIVKNIGRYTIIAIS